MRMKQVQDIMKELRFLNSSGNNKNLDEWIDGYINDCILNGRPVEILLQWCTGFGLAKRMEKQSGEFKPLPAERELVQKEIPRIIRAFTNRGLNVSWIITFNRSYIERRRLSDTVFNSYRAMIEDLADGVPGLNESILFLDWDESAPKVKPNQEIIQQFDRFVNKNALEYEIKAFMQMLKQYPDALESEEALVAEAKTRIAFESEEARFLVGPQSPFTDRKFILIPLEKPERYVFFDLLVPDFTKRIASVVKLYPWRLNP